MQSSVVVRVANEAEREQLEAIQRRASLSNPGDRDALLANPDAVELPLEQISNGHVYIAELDGTTVGFASVLPRSDGNSELDALFVEPALWRHGIGRTLVTHCILVARATGAASLHVVGNPHARDFYLACGFQVIGITETRFGAGLLMRREL